MSRVCIFLFFNVCILFFIGMLHQEELRAPILCKPRLLPLRPLTLEAIEHMQREVQMMVIGELVGTFLLIVSLLLCKLILVDYIELQDVLYSNMHIPYTSYQYSQENRLSRVPDRVSSSSR